MPSARQPSLILPVAVTLAVLLGLYVGAYYAMVMRQGPYTGEPAPYYAVALPDRLLIFRGIEPFFAPIHWLDRRIRPHVWVA